MAADYDVDRRAWENKSQNHGFGSRLWRLKFRPQDNTENGHYQGVNMTNTVTAKGQVTIPKPVRDLLGIVPGSKVDFRRTDDGNVVIVRSDGKQPASRFAKLRGHAGKGLDTDAIMALTRGDA